MDYWERETTTDLVDQLAVIRGEATPEEGGFSPAEAETNEEKSALTNKDFFWDWEGN